MIKIREVEKKDLSDILDLIRALAKFDGCLDSFQSKEKDIEEAFFSKEPKTKALIAHVDGKAAGIATYYGTYSTFKAKPGIWLDDLYVYEVYRGHGVGKGLISKLCAIAKDTGCCRLDWIVDKDNGHGRNFYLSLGATIFERVRHSRLDSKMINKLAGNA